MSRPEDNYGWAKKMKELVPEFKSKNSQYEKLDMHIIIAPQPAVKQPDQYREKHPFY